MAYSARYYKDNVSSHNEMIERINEILKEDENATIGGRMKKKIRKSKMVKSEKKPIKSKKKSGRPRKSVTKKRGRPKGKQKGGVAGEELNIKDIIAENSDLSIPDLFNLLKSEGFSNDEITGASPELNNYYLVLQNYTLPQYPQEDFSSKNRARKKMIEEILIAERETFKNKMVGGKKARSGGRSDYSPKMMTEEIRSIFIANFGRLKKKDEKFLIKALEYLMKRKEGRASNVAKKRASSSPWIKYLKEFQKQYNKTHKTPLQGSELFKKASKSYKMKKKK